MFLAAPMMQRFARPSPSWRSGPLSLGRVSPPRPRPRLGLPSAIRREHWNRSRSRQSPWRLPGLPHTLERRRPRHPHPEASQSRICEVAVGSTRTQRVPVRSHGPRSCRDPERMNGLPGSPKGSNVVRVSVADVRVEHEVNGKRAGRFWFRARNHSVSRFQ
jgi:hypothetical protein